MKKQATTPKDIDEYIASYPAPIPYDLIARIVRFRVEEQLASAVGSK